MQIQTAPINMIKQQLRTREVLNDTILNLFTSIPRQSFVPEAMQNFAYSDMRIPLGNDQYMFTPEEEGVLLQALDLQGHETILEVGTGSGYLTALLSRLGKKIISIDYYEAFTAQAQKKLDAHGIDNVELYTGDASHGWLTQAPYDVVVLTGAIEKIPPTLELQVVPGGKLFAILGQSPIMAGVLALLDHQKQWHSRLLFETNTPAFIDPLQTKPFTF